MISGFVKPAEIGQPVEFGWVATLTNGQIVYGRPSWLPSSGGIALPDPISGVGLPGLAPDADGRLPWSTDWQRLMAKCQDEQLRLTHLAILSPWGRFPAPEQRCAYGWFEPIAVDTQFGRVHGHCGVICWAERSRHDVWYTEHLALGFAPGSVTPVLERGNNRQRGGGLKACMIGSPD